MRDMINQKTMLIQFGNNWKKKFRGHPKLDKDESSPNFIWLYILPNQFSSSVRFVVFRLACLPR